MLDCGCAKRKATLSAAFPVLRRLRSTVTPEDIIAEARTLVAAKVPFHHQGYTKDGMDCVGVMGYLGLVFGFKGAQEWKDDQLCHQYGRPPNPRFLLAMCDRFFDPADTNDLRLADILVMSFETEPMHFALVSRLDPLYVIHALYGLGRVAEHRIDDNWRTRIRRSYRFRL